MQKRTRWGSAVAAALLALGAAACQSERTVQPTRERDVVRGGPASVQERVIVVREAPPAPKPDVVVVQPAPDYVWVPGHWRAADGRWDWVSGRWEAPPSGRRVWVPARYETNPDGSVAYIEGYWR